MDCDDQSAIKVDPIGIFKEKRLCINKYLQHGKHAAVYFRAHNAVE